MIIRKLNQRRQKRKIQDKENIADGLENAIDAFTKMLADKNSGKAIIKVSDKLGFSTFEGRENFFFEQKDCSTLSSWLQNGNIQTKDAYAL
jgi:hypothetical protein